MNPIEHHMVGLAQAATRVPINLSRRGFLGASIGALVLGVALPVRVARGQAVEPGKRASAFIEIRPDNTVRLQSPYIEGGQGIYTALAQIVGEELDVDPANFIVESALLAPTINWAASASPAAVALFARATTRCAVWARQRARCCFRPRPHTWMCRLEI